ncbi:tRNA pseudouridine synthase-like 1 isoform X5 [Dinothrombium tinctorium]|uniref:tRNA pseudouridine synthase n=1 Tax=Dinothrombium tinctorium TaxID=1965070 RepID=A0A443QNL7_9ACAR|nr:tRNA pseudouridine synthase-like 1 isoform X5 [Dinothrombium tinctorium]
MVQNFENNVLKNTQNGVQLQTARGKKSDETSTTFDNSIQYHLENAIGSIRPTPANQIRSMVSSRTDAGVNALSNTCHFTLVHPKSYASYSPNKIVHFTNKYLQWEKHSIFLKNGSLNFREMAEVCELFRGTYDFSAFQAKTTDIRQTIKAIDTFEMKIINEKTNCTLDPQKNNIDCILEFHVKSKSFLYRQVRRMVGCVVSVGRNCLTKEKVFAMLKDPVNNPWKFGYFAVPSCGLYLNEVHYNEEDFTNPPEYVPKKALTQSENENIEMSIFLLTGKPLKNLIYT